MRDDMRLQMQAELENAKLQMRVQQLEAAMETQAFGKRPHTPAAAVQRTAAQLAVHADTTPAANALVQPTAISPERAAVISTAAAIQPAAATCDSFLPAPDYSERGAEMISADRHTLTRSHGESAAVTATSSHARQTAFHVNKLQC